MTGESAAFLLSPEGVVVFEALNEAPRDALAAGRYIRRRFSGIPGEYLAAAMEVAEARRRAAGSVDRADELFFTREALEQSTGSPIAIHRARRFGGLAAVFDLCCGIGGDAIALGQAAGRLVCVDRDPARVLFCRENLRILGIRGEVRLGDVSDVAEEAVAADAIFIDPARRFGGRRAHRPDDMTPPLETVVPLLASSPRGAAKLSPAIDPSIVAVPHETEWISTGTGLKEALVWTGGFRRTDVSVTLIHRGCTLTSGDLPGGEPRTDLPGVYLYEPDPALIRSGLLGRAAVSHGMWRLSPDIAYMTAGHPVDDPFFTGWRVLDSFPFGLKRLRDRLRAMYAGPVTVKKRGFPLLPEEVLGKLKLTGDRPATVILTRVGGGHHAFLVERI